MLLKRLADVDAKFHARGEKELASPRQSIEQRMLRYQQECDRRARKEIEAEMEMFQDRELRRMQLDEAAKYRGQLAARVKELREEYNRELSVLRQREERVQQSFQRKQRDIESEAYDQRQRMVTQMDNLRSKEEENKRLLKHGLRELEMEKARVRDLQTKLSEKLDEASSEKSKRNRIWKSEMDAWKKEVRLQYEEREASVAKGERELSLAQREFDKKNAEMQRRWDEAMSKESALKEALQAVEENRSRAEKLSIELEQAREHLGIISSSARVDKETLRKISDENASLRASLAEAEERGSDVRSASLKRQNDQESIIQSLREKLDDALAQHARERSSLSEEIRRLKIDPEQAAETARNTIKWLERELKTQGEQLQGRIDALTAESDRLHESLAERESQVKTQGAEMAELRHLLRRARENINDEAVRKPRRSAGTNHDARDGDSRRQPRRRVLLRSSAPAQAQAASAGSAAMVIPDPNKKSVLELEQKLSKMQNELEEKAMLLQKEKAQSAKYRDLRDEAVTMRDKAVENARTVEAEAKQKMALYEIDVGRKLAEAEAARRDTEAQAKRDIAQVEALAEIKISKFEHEARSAKQSSEQALRRLQSSNASSEEQSNVAIQRIKVEYEAKLQAEQTRAREMESEMRRREEAERAARQEREKTLLEEQKALADARAEAALQAQRAAEARAAAAVLKQPQASSIVAHSESMTNALDADAQEETAAIDAARKKADEEAAAAQKKAEEEEAAAARKRAEEEAAAARKKAEEEAAAAQKKAEEEAAAAQKKAEEEAAAAQKKAEEEAAAAQKKAEEEAAAAQKKAEEDAAAAQKKAAEDAAAAKMEAARLKVRERHEKKRQQQEAQAALERRQREAAKEKEEDSDDVDDISWGSGLPIDSSRDDDRGSPSGFGGGESEITGIEDTGDMEVGEYATSSEDSF
eukprot:g1128.t1